MCACTYKPYIHTVRTLTIYFNSEIHLIAWYIKLVHNATDTFILLFACLQLMSFKGKNQMLCTKSHKKLIYKQHQKQNGRTIIVKQGQSVKLENQIFWSSFALLCLICSGNRHNKYFYHNTAQETNKTALLLLKKNHFSKKFK